ncbi:MAG: phosphotransferase enzyme family protein [Micrococcales bacterium]
MAKPIKFESLPNEIRASLERLDSTGSFEVVRSRYESITVINQRLARVYKFVRKNKKLVAFLDHEIDNLILLRNKKVAAPMVLNRQPLKQYDMVSYALIEGEILVGKLLPEHVRLVGLSQRKLHDTFERDGATKSASVNSVRALKPIFAKANAAEFEPDLISFARSISRQLKSHETAREDITFIHSDGHFWNIVFQPERAVMIDWAEAGWGSRYYDLGVTIEAILLERKAGQRDLLRAYLAAYFGEAGPTERELKLIELHVKLRMLEGATWHLNESREDQLLNRLKYTKFVTECFKKAQKFSLAAALK